MRLAAAVVAVVGRPRSWPLGVVVVAAAVSAVVAGRADRRCGPTGAPDAS